MDILSETLKTFSTCLCLAVLLLASPLLMAQETDAEPEVEENGSLVIDRIKREREAQDNRAVLLAHKRNYVLPLTYADQPNNDVFEAGSSDFGQDLDNLEIQFQLSLKAPIAEGLFIDQDALFFGFTVRAFWQAYNQEISAPFRETDYEPEIYWPPRCHGKYSAAMPALSR